MMLGLNLVGGQLIWIAPGLYITTTTPTWVRVNVPGKGRPTGGGKLQFRKKIVTVEELKVTPTSTENRKKFKCLSGKIMTEMQFSDSCGLISPRTFRRSLIPWVAHYNNRVFAKVSKKYHRSQRKRFGTSKALLSKIITTKVIKISPQQMLVR